METLYRKVAVSDRLPNDSGYYFGIDSLGHREYPYFDKEENKWESILGTTHWLEEIPDNSQQIEKLEADKAELLVFIETYYRYLNIEDQKEAKSLIKKMEQ